MHKSKEADQLIKAASDVVIVQADNPDADSLGSALAIEQILMSLDKQTYLYCGVDIPGYLRYMSGWDRVSQDLPKRFDASVIVDASTMTLLEKLVQSGNKGWLATKPCLVLDHHEVVDNLVPFASVTINMPERASTGELIYLLAKELNWPLNKASQEFIMHSILGDTQGLSNQLASPQTYRIMADLIDFGVSRPKLEETRRQFGRMPFDIFKYKAELIKRTAFSEDHKIAWLMVPQEEINKFSPLYNPAPLIQNDMLQTEGVEVAIVFKHYDDHKVTAAIRANQASPIAADLAKQFGGGGHAYAAGFKVLSVEDFKVLTDDCLKAAAQLLNKQKP